ETEVGKLFDRAGESGNRRKNQRLQIGGPVRDVQIVRQCPGGNRAVGIGGEGGLLGDVALDGVVLTGEVLDGRLHRVDVGVHRECLRRGGGGGDGQAGDAEDGSGQRIAGAGDRGAVVDRENRILAVLQCRTTGQAKGAEQSNLSGRRNIVRPEADVSRGIVGENNLAGGGVVGRRDAGGRGVDAIHHGRQRIRVDVVGDAHAVDREGAIAGPVHSGDRGAQ